VCGVLLGQGVIALFFERRKVKPLDPLWPVVAARQVNLILSLIQLALIGPDHLLPRRMRAARLRETQSSDPNRAHSHAAVRQVNADGRLRVSRVPLVLLGR
jgi:hypothetical protein